MTLSPQTAVPTALPAAAQGTALQVETPQTTTPEATPSATPPVTQKQLTPSEEPTSQKDTPTHIPEKPVQTPIQAVPVSARATRRPLISGASLSELLAAANDTEEESIDCETADQTTSIEYDPACAEKLELARVRIMGLIKEKRPRFVPAFELMTFSGNTITVSVPTEELREEILRNKTAMLMRIAELSRIEGLIELEVVVEEQMRAIRPIKLEDRVRHMTERNPLVVELRKALDLEVE